MTEDSKAVAPSWWQLTLEVPSAMAEDASASLISAGALGVQVVDNAAEPLPAYAKNSLTPHPIASQANHALLVASYQDGIEGDALRRGAVDALRELGLTIALEGVQAVKRRDRDWAERWKQYFKPIKIGRRVWIVPSWDKTFLPPTGSVVLTLDPGMAFGTGQHATTALCLKAVETWVDALPPASRQSARVADVGCGTGILAIAAAKLGVAHAAAVDNDPEAVKAAEENVRQNQVADRVAVSGQTLAALGSSYDLLVANILAHTLISIREELLRALRPGATMVLSGILAEQADEVIRAYEKTAYKIGMKGFAFVMRWTHKEWVALRFLNSLSA